MITKRITGLALAAAGACLAVGGLMAGSASAIPVPTQQVSLHNATADVGTDCPDETNDYWHFIIAPNNGTYHFVTIHLVVDGTGYDFSAWSSILKNGSQEDNVFVQVPAGKTLADIELVGSYATMTPDTPAPTNFTLSHLCDGSTVDTTDGGTTIPETTSPDTTSPDTTVPDTTVPDTTVPDTTSPATTVPDTTSPDTGGEGNSTTPTTDAGSGGGLPGTGSDNSSLVVLGAVLTIGGLAIATMSRRRITN